MVSVSGRRPGSLQRLDDAEVALTRLVEHLERRLIGGAVVAGGRCRDAVELGDHHALLDTGLVDLRRDAAREEASAPL